MHYISKRAATAVSMLILRNNGTLQKYSISLRSKDFTK